MIKKESKEIKDFFKNLIKNKKIQWILTILIFLVILFYSISIRVSNLEFLKDSTSGKYISIDLDSLLFYRQAETRMKFGYWPEYDEMRSPGYKIGWIREFINDVLIWNYKILKFFNREITYDYASAISIPIFFGFLMIAFFILLFLLTKSKIASILGCAFLAYAPSFLFRSIAGFYDHDPLGVFAIFLLIIFCLFSLKNLEKSYKNSILFGIGSGFLTAFVLYCWGGAITFVLVFLPFSLLLHYLFNVEKREKFILFNLIWIFSSIIFTPLLGMDVRHMTNRFLDAQGILVLFVLSFSIVDFLLFKFKDKINFIKKDFFHFYSLGLTLILGIFGFYTIGKNPLRILRKAWATLIYPFFGEFIGRLETTVAENAQPYLVDLINQKGIIIFVLFLVGLVFVCLNLVSNSKSLKNKMILASSSMLVLFSILFSRISSSSLLNGENFISQTLYAVGGIIFIFSLFYVASKEKFKISVNNILLFSIGITVSMNARSAIRSFFLITPFICLIASSGISEFLKKVKEVKEKETKIIFYFLIFVILVLSYIHLFGFPFIKNNFENYEREGIYRISSFQAKRIVPSANIQWQRTMEWVRKETPEKSIFVHWWDYGYFIQTLGERPTVTDGGHSGGGHTDHYIGRYILTTPNPKTALSFMKTWNVSYLLIDPTEMGKYGAFSKIGSNDSWDRVSSGIFGGVIDKRQNQETLRGETRVYQLGGCVDEDIIFENGSGQRTFIPGIKVTKTQQMVCNSYVAGVIIEIENLKNESSIKQPIGVFFYNNKQYRIPIKNIFADGKFYSFNEGINSVVYFIPYIDENERKIVKNGAIIYLSPRTFNSLMGRLYILNDPFEEYPTIKRARFEDDPYVAHFKQFYPGLNEFVWYHGLRAPLKIWEVNYPDGTPVHEEFLDRNRELKFGGLDYLFE